MPSGKRAKYDDLDMEMLSTSPALGQWGLSAQKTSNEEFDVFFVVGLDKLLNK